MHPQDDVANPAVGRVLDRLIKDIRRRQDHVRSASQRLIDRHHADIAYATSIRIEAAATIDGLNWTADRINDYRLEASRFAERRRESTIAEHTTQVDLP